MKKMVLVATFLMTATISPDLKLSHPTQAGLLQQKSSNYIMHYILFGKMKIMMV